MAHELTHALQDQHFHLQKVAGRRQGQRRRILARDAVLEGSAMLAMLDYVLRDTGKSVRDIPGFDPSVFMGDANNSPAFADAPLVLQDEMLFPYLAGSAFADRAC